MIHRLPSKAALARHLCWPNGLLMMTPEQVSKWSQEELEAEHKNQHEFNVRNHFNEITNEKETA